jgi:hypothetical protein
MRKLNKETQQSQKLNTLSFKEDTLSYAELSCGRIKYSPPKARVNIGFTEPFSVRFPFSLPLYNGMKSSQYDSS